MQEGLKSGEVVLDRFVVEQFIAKGSFGAVYLVQDQQNDEKCILKVMPKPADPVFVEYVKHLKILQEYLSDKRDCGIIVPSFIFETEKFVYQTFPYLGPGVLSLATILREEGALEPRRALNVIRDVAIALDAIHSQNILHADIKPTNILITADGRVYLTDFGLAQRSETEESVVWVGTYRYAHPALKDYLPKRPGTTTAAIQPTSCGVGSYVDIYSLGIVAIEMLTGDPSVPSPLSEERIKLLLNQRSPRLRLFPDSIVDKLGNLVFRMLNTSPGKKGISAGTISTIAATLAEEFRIERAPSAPPEQIVVTEVKRVLPTYSGTVRDMKSVLERVERVMESLISSTAAMVRTTKQLSYIPLTESAPGMVQEMNKAFETTRQRIKTSWNIAILMTIACFVLLFVLVSIAIALSVVRQESAWGLIFGGASIPTIIGILIWRPYDRIFKATILAQQLEIIHIQSISGLRASDDVNRRIQVCREALEGLQTLLESYAEAQGKNKGARQKKR